VVKVAAEACSGGHPANPRRQRVAFLWLAVYAIFLAASPFGHHDLLCELKTPFHCTVCVSSVVGSDPAQLAIAASWTLSDLGLAITPDFANHGILLSVCTPGRSPPISA
jgi:hypothetical protein